MQLVCNFLFPVLVLIGNIAAPKVNTVNEQVRAGAGERNAQVADLATSNAIGLFSLRLCSYYLLMFY